MTLNFKNNEKVRDKFLHWLLVDEEHGVIKFAENKKVIQDVADLYLRKINGEQVTKEEWQKADATAADAAAAAAAAAWADADAAAEKMQEKKLAELFKEEK